MSAQLRHDVRLHKPRPNTAASSTMPSAASTATGSTAHRCGPTRRWPRSTAMPPRPNTSRRSPPHRRQLVCRSRPRRAFQAPAETEGGVRDLVSEVYRHSTRERCWITENAWYVRDADRQSALHRRHHPGCHRTRAGHGDHRAPGQYRCPDRCRQPLPLPQHAERHDPRYQRRACSYRSTSTTSRK